MSFKNCILLVNYNYSKHIDSSKQLLYELYSPAFKKVIFYSDLPANHTSGVEFVYTDRGRIVQNVFPDFYGKYKVDIEKCDGVFFLMDDVLLMINALGDFDCKKIVQIPSYIGGKNPEIDKGDEPIILGYSQASSVEKLRESPNGPWRNQRHRGFRAVERLIEDSDFKRENMEEFSFNYPDFFFLPKKYINDFCRISAYFGTYEVWLSIALGSTISHLEPDPTKYNKNFRVLLQWQDSRCLNDQVMTKLAGGQISFMHPVKFSQLGSEVKSRLVSMSRFGIDNRIENSY